MRLLLLRHGQTHGNTRGALDTGFPGNDLTELGVRQAEAAARVLADDPPAAIYVSTLVRTQQTAAPLAAALGLEPVVREGLREISAGEYEMATDHESIHGYITTVADWIEGRTETRMPGGEVGTDFLARYDEVVREILASGHDRVLIVSHGAAIRTWVASRVTDSETHEMATEGLANTACIQLDGSFEDGWTVATWDAEPVGGAYLDDHVAPDPTGQDLDEN